MNTLKAALIQQKHTDDAAANRRHSADAIRQAHANGAKLVVLSELHVTRYFCQTENPAAFDLAEPIPRSIDRCVRRAGRELVSYW